MPRKKFLPPQYEESLHVLFDKATGEVLATEERWDLVKENAAMDPPAFSELFRTVARQAGKHVEELDVLILRGGSGRQSIHRVNVHERAPISEEMSVATTKPGSPSKIAAP